MRRLLVLLVLAVVVQEPSAEAASPASVACRSGSQTMAQVELYFGAGRRPDRIARRAWQTFLARVVTPRFPDGLTVLEGEGQWHGRHGLERETSHVITILYRPDTKSDEAIETIRTSYKAAFRQQSVLRVDTAVCASF